MCSNIKKLDLPLFGLPLQRHCIMGRGTCSELADLFKREGQTATRSNPIYGIGVKFGRTTGGDIEVDARVRTIHPQTTTVKSLPRSNTRAKHSLEQIQSDSNASSDLRRCAVQPRPPFEACAAWGHRCVCRRDQGHTPVHYRTVRCLQRSTRHRVQAETGQKGRLQWFREKVRDRV